MPATVAAPTDSSMTVALGVFTRTKDASVATSPVKLGGVITNVAGVSRLISRGLVAVGGVAKTSEPMLSYSAAVRFNTFVALGCRWTTASMPGGTGRGSGVPASSVSTTVFGQAASADEDCRKVA